MPSLARLVRRAGTSLVLAAALVAQPLVASAHTGAPSAPVVHGGEGGWVQVAPRPLLAGLAASRFQAGEVRTVAVPSGAALPTGSRSFAVQVVVESARPGTVALWGASPAPSASQVTFSAGASSSTTLVRADDTGRITVRSSVAARLSVSVVGVIQGSGSAVGAGGTVVVAPSSLVDSATGQGGDVPAPGTTSSVPVTGLAGIPATGARAVWLSVQGRASRSGSVSFVDPSGGLPSASAVSLSSAWTNVLVPVPIDDDGTVTYAVRGSAVADLRMTVVGWIADTATGGVVLPAAAGVVPLAARSIATTSGHGSASVRTLKVGGKDVPTSASGVLLGVSVRGAGRDGRPWSTVAPFAGLSSGAGVVAAGEGARTTQTQVVPLGADGTVRLTTSPASRLDRVMLLGYVVAEVDSSRDRQAPTLVVTSPEAGLELDQGQTPELVVAGTVSDAGSGVRDVRASVDGETLGSAKLRAGADGTQTWSLTVPTVAGTHRISVVATDWAGRSATVTRGFTVVAAASGDVPRHARAGRRLTPAGQGAGECRGRPEVSGRRWCGGRRAARGARRASARRGPGRGARRPDRARPGPRRHVSGRPARRPAR